MFDTGARNTYVTPSVAQVLKTSTMLHAFRAKLGGEVRETKTSAILEAEIEGHPIATHALVLEEIGKDEDGRPIEILFGSLAMQQWGIRPMKKSDSICRAIRKSLSNSSQGQLRFSVQQVPSFFVFRVRFFPQRRKGAKAQII